MSTSQLLIYNDALTICGERHLANLSEEREPRRLLDHVWDKGGVKRCLESGQWKFAMRTIMLDFDPDITTDFGYRRAFLKPTDWCATSSVCQDEYFNVPLTRYNDETTHWYADIDTIYIRYVSDHASYGGDLSLWTGNFADYVAAYFATVIILKLTSDEKRRNAVFKIEKKAKSLAKSHDTMSDPTKFPAQGSWVTSREGWGNARRDRGNRGSLIG